MTEAKNSRAKIKANAKYDAKTYDRMSFRLRKGDDISKEELTRYANECGESLNQFILNAIYERINMLNSN